MTAPGDTGIQTGGLFIGGGIMKRRLTTILVLCWAMMLVQPALAEPAVLHSITAEEIQATLGDLGFTGSEIDEDGDVIVMMHGRAALVVVGSGNARQLRILVAFTEPRLSLEQVNYWNRTRFLSRAYLDTDGDTILESDLDMDGGVTMNRVKDWLHTFGDTINVFIREIIQGQGSGGGPSRPLRPSQLGA
jgi:hypothetical protein